MGPEPVRSARRHGTPDSLGRHNRLRVKKPLEDLSGVKFKLKDFTATFAQDYIDKCVSVAEASKGLRHGTTNTKETFHGRVKSERTSRALEQADELWSAQLGLQRRLGKSDRLGNRLSDASSDGNGQTSYDWLILTIVVAS